MPKTTPTAQLRDVIRALRARGVTLIVPSVLAERWAPAPTAEQAAWLRGQLATLGARP
jgi:hypothetical protein